jgi:hypothetical protein
MTYPPMLVAYFGPEVQLPLVSLIGSIVGLGMMAAGLPYRFIKEKLRGWKGFASNRGEGR